MGSACLIISMGIGSLRRWPPLNVTLISWVSFDNIIVLFLGFFHCPMEHSHPSVFSHFFQKDTPTPIRLHLLIVHPLWVYVGPFHLKHHTDHYSFSMRLTTNSTKSIASLGPIGTRARSPSMMWESSVLC